MRSWILGITIVLAASAARADDKAQAKALYDEGLRHYNIAEYTQAIDDWKQSYLLSKKPLLLFNIAQAYRLSGDCKQAMTFYDNYTNAEPNPKNQDELDQAVATCKDKLSQAPTDTKPADTKPADTKPVDTNPVPPKPVETRPVETRPVVLHQPPPPPAPETSSSGHRGLAIGIAVAGGVLEAGTVYFALDGHAKQSSLESYIAQTHAFDAHAKDLQSRGQLDNNLAWGCGIAGGVALVAGAVLLATGHGSEHAVAVAPAPGGVQIGFSGRF